MSYIWWRDSCNLPSVKALKAVFGDKAKEARQLLEGNIKTTDYSCVNGWVNSCWHKPSYTARVLYALNYLAGTFGVEHQKEGSNAKSPAFDYLNAGDMYAPTLMLIQGRGFKVMSVGDMIERGNYN